MTDLYVLITGDPGDGFKYWGPVDEAVGEATAKAYAAQGGEVWMYPLAPSVGLAGPVEAESPVDPPAPRPMPEFDVASAFSHVRLGGGRWGPKGV